MSKSEVLHRFRNRVAAACAPLGAKPADVTVTGSGLSVPTLGVAIDLVSSEGRRVWRATQSSLVRQLGDDTEVSYRTVLFEEPFDREWTVARRLALRLAEARIDAAIDAAA